MRDLLLTALCILVCCIPLNAQQIGSDIRTTVTDENQSLKRFSNTWVENVYPAQNSLFATSDVEITVTFDEDIDPATLNETTIRINGHQSGVHTFSIDYDSITRLATFTPAHSFFAGEIVQISVTSNVQNNDGDYMPAGFIWRFRIKPESGSAVFEEHDSYMIEDDYPSQPVAIDVDKDQDVDLFSNGGLYPQIHTYLNDGEGVFSPISPFQIDLFAFDVCDMDQDGDLDVISIMEIDDVLEIVLIDYDGSGVFSVTSLDVLSGNDPDIYISLRWLSCVDIDGEWRQ